MKITLKQLQVFVHTAKTQSISLGAEKCFISQAAASMSLSQLENLLGMKLFDRVAKRMKLNSNGQKLLAKAIQVIDQVHEIEDYCDHNISGSITIGASTTIANYILPKYIAKFKTFYPNTNIKLVSGNTQDIISMVELINCDVGFVEGKCDSTSIDVTHWKKDFLNIICNSNHKLIGKNDISVSDIIKYEWAMREIGSGTSDALLDALTTKYYSKLKTSIILNNSEAIKQYVINSQSLACLSESILKQDNGNNEYHILDVTNLSLERSFYKLMHNSKYHSNLTTVFCKFVSEQDN